MSTSLEARLARLEAGQEISVLMSRYLDIVDNGEDPSAVADLFIEDAVYVPKGNLSENGVIEGRESLRTLFANVRDMLPFAVHYLTNEIVDVNEDATEASGQWYAFELATINPSRESLVLCGLYQNQFTRVDGQWMIKKIEFSDMVSFPQTKGWRDIRYVSMVDGQERTWPNT